jgi:signal transduction histidine kinase
VDKRSVPEADRHHASVGPGNYGWRLEPSHPLRSINDDLSSLARTFNRLFERIEKLLLANRHVSADIAHDLRKPLASILRRLEAVRSGESSPGQMLLAVQASTTGIEEVLRTFNALLRIGEVESGARRAAFRPVDLSEIANKVADAYQPVAEKESIRLATHLDTALLMHGDKELLSQMIANLLDNALRYTPGGGRVEVIGERTSRGVSLSVSDDGPGIPPKHLKAIFHRFYRVEATPQKSAGTGLGLSLVAAIAELHELDYSASDNQPGLRITLTTTNEEI